MVLFSISLSDSLLKGYGAGSVVGETHFLGAGSSSLCLSPLSSPPSRTQNTQTTIIAFIAAPRDVPPPGVSFPHVIDRKHNLLRPQLPQCAPRVHFQNIPYTNACWGYMNPKTLCFGSTQPAERESYTATHANIRRRTPEWLF